MPSSTALAATLLVVAAFAVFSACTEPPDSTLVVDNRSDAPIVVFKDSQRTSAVDPHARNEAVIFEFEGTVTWSLRRPGSNEDIASETVTFDDMREMGGLVFTIE